MEDQTNKNKTTCRGGGKADTEDVPGFGRGGGAGGENIEDLDRGESCGRAKKGGMAVGEAKGEGVEAWACS